MLKKQNKQARIFHLASKKQNQWLQQQAKPWPPQNPCTINPFGTKTFSRHQKQRYKARKSTDAILQQTIDKERNEQARREAQQIKQATRLIYLTYGFTALLQLTVSQNARLQLRAMPDWLYFSRPSNIAYHNLAKNYNIPVHLRSLLGLGLNYCMRQPSLLGSRALDCHQFQQDIFTKMIYAGSQTPAPPLHAPSNWQPNPSQIPLELWVRVSHFLRTLKTTFKTKRVTTNLLPLQTAAFRYLKASNNSTVLKTDKNLGPAVMQVLEYKALAYRDHLSHNQTYQQLTSDQARICVKTSHQILQGFITKYFPVEDQSQEHDQKYLERTLHLSSVLCEISYTNQKLQRHLQAMRTNCLKF